MSKTGIQKLGELGLDLLAALDDSKCYVRCEHGGACGLEPEHSGSHDSNGHCQWTDPPEDTK